MKLKSKHIKILGLFFIFGAMTVLWQNCSGIKLSHTANNSIACVASDFLIAEDTPGASTTRLFVDDSTGHPVPQTFQWSLTDANDNPISPIQTISSTEFTINTTTLTACTTYHVHAKFEDCSGPRDLVFPYIKIGPACTPIVDPPTNGGGACPDGQLLTSSVYYPNTDFHYRGNVDLTKYENIFGHSTSTDTATLFPGRAGSSPVIMQFMVNKYIAAKFTVPLDATSNQSGFFGESSYFGGTKLKMAISQTCGDFNPADPVCVREATTGETLVGWRVATGPKCILIPGQTYYMNIKISDPSHLNSNCPNSTYCNTGMNNTF